MTDTQDLIVVGAGSGGFAAAMRAAQVGGKVTIIEQALYGGNCMHKACIPTKVLMTAARSMATIRQAGRYGVRAGEQPQVHLESLHERKEVILEGLRMGTEQLLADRGVRLIEGRAKVVAPDTVEVNGEQFRARHIVLATGSIPAQHPFEGIELPGVIGTEEAIELREVPRRLAVLGSRHWDLELAQCFHMLGSEVTLIESGKRLLPEADREISQRLGKALYDAGITIKRGVEVEAIRQAGDGALTVTLAEGKGEIAADKVLASRRLPNSTGLGLRELGLKMEHGAVLVDERMRTNIPLSLIHISEPTRQLTQSRLPSCG